MSWDSGENAFLVLIHLMSVLGPKNLLKKNKVGKKIKCQCCKSCFIGYKLIFVRSLENVLCSHSWYSLLVKAQHREKGSIRLLLGVILGRDHVSEQGRDVLSLPAHFSALAFFIVAHYLAHGSVLESFQSTPSLSSSFQKLNLQRVMAGIWDNIYK